MVPSRKLPTRLRWLPSSILLLGLIATMGTAYTLAEISRERASLRFATSVEHTRAAIEARLEAQISLLRGIVGLFAASAEVTPEEFRRYVETLSIRENYPGVQGLGFSARVLPEEREAFLAQVRAEGQPDFRIWPQGSRDEYHAIRYLEPLDRRNRAALGYDMSTEPTRRVAMEQARDSGQPTLSGKVTLVQEIDEQKQAGFLIYLPIYDDGLTPAQVEDRRSKLVGFAYSPFRADDLFLGIFSEGDVSRVAFTIYDGPTAAPDALLHESLDMGGEGRGARTTSETIEVAGRSWSIVYRALPSLEASGDSYVAPVVLALGIIGSLIIFLLVQAQTTARHEAEQAVKARDTFLSVASHELKTPLTALLGNAQLLRRRTVGRDTLTPGEHRNIDAIIEGGQRLRKLVDELLDHTRLMEGRLQLERQQLELGALVVRVADEVRPTLVRHTLTVREAAGALTICGDPLRLEQVLLNLIDNGVKYSPAGGPIEIRLERAAPWAIIQVRDQGIGVPASALPLLFDQFYRSPNAVSKHIAGMGIGLFVVKAIVERHGGSITVESAEGQGSTFRLYLPLAEDSATLSKPAHQSDPPLSPRRP